MGRCLQFGGVLRYVSGHAVSGVEELLTVRRYGGGRFVSVGRVGGRVEAGVRVPGLGTV